MAATGNPLVEWVKAWGEVTERSFARMVAKPDWGISAVTGDDGRDHTVRIETLVSKPFGNLIHFRVPGPRSPPAARPPGGADVGALRHAPAQDGDQPPARLRGLRHRLAQRPRHSRLRRQVRRRGLHPLRRRVHAAPRAGPPRHRHLPARAAGARRDGAPGRGGARGAAPHADPDRRADRPGRQPDRGHRLRPPHHHGRAGADGDPAGRLQVSGAWAGWSIRACCSLRPSCR